MEFYQPENYLNLARTLLMRGDRRAATEAVIQGLRVDPSHMGLGALQERMGVRRPLPISFLGRSNTLNLLVGRLLSAIGR